MRRGAQGRQSSSSQITSFEEEALRYGVLEWGTTEVDRESVCCAVKASAIVHACMELVGLGSSEQALCVCRAKAKACGMRFCEEMSVRREEIARNKDCRGNWSLLKSRD